MFISKIVDARPQGVELAQWLELIFGLHERDIIQYESLRNFIVPGLFKPAPQVRIAGLKIPRNVHARQRVWVRFDLKYPNVIDLEAPIAHGNEPRLFQLTRPEWDHVKMWLTPVTDEDKAFHEKDCVNNKVRRSK